MKKQNIEQTKFEDWFMKNLIYCQDTHSFVHRLFEVFKKSMPVSYRDAQFVGGEIFNTMYEEYRKGKNG